jgi:hypothetical protein
MPPAWLRRPGDVAPAHRRAPSDVYDDAEEMQRWVSVSVEAGRRRVVKKRPKRDAAANAARSRGSPRSS